MKRRGHRYGPRPAVSRTESLLMRARVIRALLLTIRKFCSRSETEGVNYSLRIARITLSRLLTHSK